MLLIVYFLAVDAQLRHETSLFTSMEYVNDKKKFSFSFSKHTVDTVLSDSTPENLANF